MNEIKCPNCGEVFTVNESQYSELLSQVRTAEFDKEIHERIRQELALAEQKALNEQQEKLAKKDQEIAQLQNQIQQFDTEKELAKKEVEQSASQSLLAKEKEVQALENQLATLRLEHENQLQKTLSDLEKERDQVKNQLLLQEKENELSLASVKQNYEAQLKAANEQVEFYISTNPGEGFKPLVKVASGGELSRLMLAIKSAFARKEDKTSIVFDEVDTGVSGRVAQAIAQKIHKIGSHGQVLAISHLPQVIAIADYQFFISKESDNETTVSRVRLLTPEERVQEIAKMLAGDNVTEAALSQARALLKVDDSL